MKDITGRNKTNMQLDNRSLLLSLIKNNENICRKDLAELSGLTGAAVTNLIRALVEVGIVSEHRDYQGSRSRNAISLRINYEKYLIIGVSFRRGSINYGVADLSGKVLKRHELFLDLDQSVDHVFTALSTAIDNCSEEFAEKGTIVGLGLASPGPINNKKGQISFLTNVEGWKDVPIKKYFQDKYDFPVILIEAANATAIAEKWFGCAQDSKNFISVLVSKGVGAGIVLNNNLYYGNAGYAGEIGHASINYNGPSCQCGNRGCLELYCSTLTLLKRAQAVYGTKLLKKIDDLFRFSNGNNQELINLVKENGQYLGYAIVNIINSFNPELIVINSEIKHFGDIWLQAINSSVNSRLLPESFSDIAIKYSTLDDDPVFLGAIAMVCEYVFNKPQLGYFMEKEKITS